jgi:hypothetical protein
VFWKLSKIKLRGRNVVPLKYRVIASLFVLLLIPAIILFSMAIVVLLAIGLIIAAIVFVLRVFRVPF